MSLSIVITKEELLKKESEQRIWHAAHIMSDEAICGVKGKWVGVGYITTCPACLLKLGDRDKIITRYALSAPKLIKDQKGRKYAKTTPS